MKFLEVKESLILSFKNVVQTLTRKLKDGTIIPKESLNSSKLNNKTLDEVAQYTIYKNLTFDNIFLKIPNASKKLVWNIDKTIKSVIVTNDDVVITKNYTYEIKDTLKRINFIDLIIDDDSINGIINSTIDAKKKTLIYNDESFISTIKEIIYS
jgi:hypothetical protein